MRTYAVLVLVIAEDGQRTHTDTFDIRAASANDAIALAARHNPPDVRETDQLMISCEEATPAEEIQPVRISMKGMPRPLHGQEPEPGLHAALSAAWKAQAEVWQKEVTDATQQGREPDHDKPMAEYDRVMRSHGFDPDDEDYQ